MDAVAQVEVLAYSGLAALCGAAIGTERERSGKVAGLRTHILVSSSSAIATGVGAAMVGSGDPTRVLHGVITGIGFLGTGVIFKDDRQPAGITSAAAIMLTAMIGAVCGLGAPILAVGATSFALGTLWYARRVENQLNQHWERRERRQARRRHRLNRPGPGVTMRDLREPPTIDLTDRALAGATTRPNPRPNPRPAPRDPSRTVSEPARTCSPSRGS